MKHQSMEPQLAIPARWLQPDHAMQPRTVRHESLGFQLPIPWAKLLFDKVFSAIALIAATPLMIAIAIAIRLESNGPIFFGHERVGHGGRRFMCLKFRTMLPDSGTLLDALLEIDPIARDDWQTQRKLDRDPRVSRLGTFLRKTSLDELPQFWNILVGDMSVVGPRPVTAEESIFYGKNFAAYISCRPGLTGAWQVSGRSETSYDERVALDVDYLHGWTMKTDLKIVLKTASVVLWQRGAF